MAEIKTLSADSIPHFQEGISLVLSKWWTLQMAVQNEWGGPHSQQKALDFSSRIFNFFHKPNRKEPVYIDELEDLLEDGLDSLNTDAEDDVLEVADQLMAMYEECLVGNYQSIQKLKQTKPLTVPRVEQDASDSDEGGDESMGNEEESNMMVDTPESLPSTNPTEIQKNNGRHQQMEEAEDGWVKVSRKSKGRNK
ncbi:pre-rRNA-processing protein TSR2 homolog [Chenopodium quinoa]|uniref:Pre-rRNA-processing protein TSR2 n=1 Tax=Chenopodium quinoa TaxID=63459 RepID=A0A803KPK4_CHEQI|nr:pre-rRNA-processing protein TSR2 homolog [Chenopodium quinoa]